MVVSSVGFWCFWSSCAFFLRGSSQEAVPEEAVPFEEARSSFEEAARRTGVGMEAAFSIAGGCGLLLVLVPPVVIRQPRTPCDMHAITPGRGMHVAALLSCRSVSAPVSMLSMLQLSFLAAWLVCGLGSCLDCGPPGLLVPRADIEDRERKPGAVVAGLAVRGEYLDDKDCS